MRSSPELMEPASRRSLCARPRFSVAVRGRWRVKDPGQLFIGLEERTRNRHVPAQFASDETGRIGFRQ